MTRPCFAVIIACRWPRWPRPQPDSSRDQAVRVVPMFGLGMPHFWVGIMLILLFGLHLGRLFPVGGYGDGFAGHLHSMFLPAFTVALAISPILIRSLRASLLNVLGRDYIDDRPVQGHLRAARRPPARAAQRASSRRSPCSASTSATWSGGTLVIEKVFALPGIGSLMINAIFAARLHRRPGHHAGVRDPGGARSTAHRRRPRAARPAGRGSTEWRDAAAARLSPAAARSAPSRRAGSAAAGTGRRPGGRAGDPRARWCSLAVLAPLITPLRPDPAGPAQHPAGARRASTGWAPTSSAATSGPADLRRPRRPQVGFLAVLLPFVHRHGAGLHRRATSAAGSTRSSCASSTSSSRSRSTC